MPIDYSEIMELSGEWRKATLAELQEHFKK